MKKDRTVKLSDIVVLKLTECIQKKIYDFNFSAFFLSYFENDYSQRNFIEVDRWSIQRWFEECLVILFEDYKFECLSWNQYCLSMKKVRIHSWISSNRYEVLLSKQRMARKLLSGLYNYAIDNLEVETKEIIELRKHREFLIFDERKLKFVKNSLSEYQMDRLGTNFPIESSFEQLHLFPGDDKRYPIVINFNVCSLEIKTLLIEFYESESSSSHQNNSIRQFVYLFKYSLLSLDKEPNIITDFTFDSFKKQYRFYQKTNIINKGLTRSFPILITRFYVHLCKKIREKNIDHDIFKGTNYSESMLGSNTFSIKYERGFEPITFNAFEKIPLENRWLLKVNDGFANSKKYNVGCDFTLVLDKTFRDELKYFVWNQINMSVSTVASHMSRCIDFLNFISRYKKHNKTDSFVNVELIEQWNLYVGCREPSTMNSYIKLSRAYLIFYKEKYSIPSLIIDMLKQQKMDRDGGTPMTKHDVDLFHKKFLEQKSKGIMEELAYIIFYLTVTTKLRLGEVLNLERNCIVDKSENTGTIRCHLKTSGKQKVNVILALEKIMLIERAITLTQDAFSKASEINAKYIFIKEDYWRKDRIIDVVFQFTNKFAEIQKDLEGLLDNTYRPYSLRTTFIDNIYVEGIKDGLPTSVIAEMAGNGETTALRYYRKITAAKEYAEMFSGVVISGVDIYGNILEEVELKDQSPVEGGLGGCNQDGCVKDEDQYKCLICSHFATTINRIPLFKERIIRLKIQKESTLNNQQRNFIDAELKLYTVYYVKLLERLGEN
jgi:integrase